jgi:hypothetical protein
MVGADDKGKIKSTFNCRYRSYIILNLKSRAMEVKGFSVEAYELMPPFMIPISPANLPYHFADQPCWERAIASNLTVAPVIKLISAKSLRAKGNISNFVEGFVIGIKCFKENKSIFFRDVKLELEGFFD